MTLEQEMELISMALERHAEEVADLMARHRIEIDTMIDEMVARLPKP